MDSQYPLCYRCEHRAKAHETGWGPRVECKDLGRAVVACYMYRPVTPVTLEPIEGEDRDILEAPMLAGRSRGIGLAHGTVKARRTDDGAIVWFEPEV